MSTSREPKGTSPPTIREALGLLLRLLRLVRPFWSPLLKAFAVAAVTSLLGLAVPFISKLLIDQVHPGRDVTLLQALVAGYLIINLTTTGLGALRGYYAQVIGAQMYTAVGLTFFNHLQHARVQFVERRRVGEIMSRLQDVRSSLGAVARVLEIGTVQTLYFLLVPPLLFLLSWKLALLVLVTTPLTAVTTLLAGRIIRRYAKEAAEAQAELGALEFEMLAHVRTLKSAAAEPFVFHRTKSAAEAAQRLQLRSSGLNTILAAVNGTVRAIGSGALLWYGWVLIIRGEITLGSYIAFAAYQTYLTGPINRVTSFVSSFQQTAVSLGRVFEYLDEPPEQEPSLVFSPTIPVTHTIRGELRLEDVSFRYEAEEFVLRDLTIDYRAGSITAIVGDSGVGKSTLLRLLCRIDDPTRGRILVDRVPCQQIPLVDLRRQISLVWQDVALLRGSLWDNLTLGAESPRPEAVAEVVQVCRLDGLVSRLPAGYETDVAEWGASLSAGERQRIAIARALLRAAPVLLLDEPTSHLDPATEREVMRGVIEYASGSTIVFVTHRLSMIGCADRIILLHRGGTATVGTHAELLAGSEAYRSLHEAGKPAERVQPLRLFPTDDQSTLSSRPAGEP